MKGLRQCVDLKLAYIDAVIDFIFGQCTCQYVGFLMQLFV